MSAVKSQGVKILGFAGPVVSVTTSQLCTVKQMKPSTARNQMGVLLPMKLYLPENRDSTWLMGVVCQLLP